MSKDESRINSQKKGGCNPRLIDREVKVVNGRLAISLADVKKQPIFFRFP